MEAIPAAEITPDAIVHLLDNAVVSLFRTKAHMTRWLAVILPNNAGTDWAVLGNLSRVADRLKMVLKGHGTDVEIRFDRDPVKRVWNPSYKPV
jgi:hypothetical protein